MADYDPGRPMMTAAELDEHKVHEYGRNYAESDDGYGDMAAEEKRGWHVIPGWGRDGWDLGDWPYVMIYAMERDAKFGLMQICEGDRTVYWFDQAQDRLAAIDYMFLWYAADRSWSPLTWEERPRLDAGEIDVNPKFRGPYRRGGEVRAWWLS